MSRNSILFGLAAVLTASTPLSARADMVFNRIATFAVADNLPADIDPTSATSSEIIAASNDGNTLVYSDSPLGAVGFIDITDPRAPKATGIVKIDGEPTSLTLAGNTVLAAVNTSKSYTEPSGVLYAIDLATHAATATCDLGGQPDSVALSKDGAFLAIAIENERDEEFNDGEIPQLPAGDLVIVPVSGGQPDCAGLRHVDLTGIAEIAPTDPEPEFVDFNAAGEIAVTLQENNHIAIVNAATGEIVAHFSAGRVSLDHVDTKKDGAINFTGSVENVLREPDAVQWLDDNRLVIANEGDYHGGSRGFTILSKTGGVLYESGPSFEYVAASLGHYPEGRSGKKGIEPEGLEFATFGDTPYIFVAAERASLLGVYKDTGGEPQYVQALPSGIGPEGLVAIPGRNLLATANETDLGEDGAARSHVMIYEFAEGTPSYPMIASATTDDGTPIGWGALSGLTAAPGQPGMLYGISDSVYGNAPAIYTIDATQTPAIITARTIVSRDGAVAQKLDLEGIASDGQNGFWLASEGNSAKLTPHAVFHVRANGAIDKEIALPAELLDHEIRFGMEGITTVGTGDDEMLVMAVQREWRDDPKGFVKLIAYTPKTRKWSAVRYPLEPKGAGWMGLSEITAHDGKLYIVERDNQIGEAARVKGVYSVSLEGFEPAELGGELPVVEKTLVRNLLPDLLSTHGYVVDKVEGFTIDAAGDAYFITDNDGVDDSSGETVFVKLGKL